MQEGSSLNLKEGQIWSVRDLLYGLIMRSGNDAAVALAEHISGSESKFVELMNKKLIDYGLTNSHFTNASGLDSKNHYSSASDVAKMLQIALESSLFRAISSTTLYKNNTYNSYWTNKHKLIGSSDILATSGKTGYTKKLVEL